MTATWHPALSLPYSERAELQNTPLLASYLLHLISIKRSNLCVSADVNSTAALLRLAEDVGDSICVLKTHADIIDDFSAKTIKGLNAVSQRKRFLIFEDRKFGDIGSTRYPGPNPLLYLHSQLPAERPNLARPKQTQSNPSTPAGPSPSPLGPT